VGDRLEAFAQGPPTIGPTSHADEYSPQGGSRQAGENRRVFDLLAIELSTIHLVPHSSE
jgi:hypothetical protein